MKRSNFQTNWAVCVICGLAALSTGCQTTSRAETGALAGAGLGGTMGALIGSQNGRAGSGAVLGAMAGAVVGGLAGEAEDARDERDAAIAQAQYERDVAARQSVTNYDLITMAQAGVTDAVIVNSVKTRGGQFDLSPSAIIELKSRGVSDNVILQIQQSSEQGLARPAMVSSRPVTTIVTTPPPVYIVRPAPVARVGLYFGPRHYGHYHRSHRHYW